MAIDTHNVVHANELKDILDPAKYVGRSPEQVTEFLTECVNPILEQYKDELGVTVEINV